MYWVFSNNTYGCPKEDRLHMVGNMGRYSDSLLLELTYEEAFDLFTRCLKSSDEDNEESRTVLMKLGRLLDQFQLPKAA